MSLNDRAPGSRLAAGTRTLSSVMSACHTERSDTFPSMTRAWNPAAPFSTTKAPTWPSSVSRAHTTTRSATVPRPIHRFLPFSTHPSPSGRAEVSSAIESDPWSGSVSAKAPSLSIRAMSGSHRAFCSSEPHIAIDCMARPACTPRTTPRLPSPRCSSMVTSPHASGLIPAHSYPLMSSPTTPSSGSLRTSCHGISARSQYGPMTGTTSSSTNRRTAAKCAHCSSVNCSRTEKKSVPRDSPSCVLATCVIPGSPRR